MKSICSACTVVAFVSVFFDGMRTTDAMKGSGSFKRNKGDAPEESGSNKDALKNKSSGSFKSNKSDVLDESSSRKSKILGRLFSSKSSKSLATSSSMSREIRSSGRLTSVNVIDPSVFLSGMEKLPVLTDENWTASLELAEPLNNIEEVNDARQKMGEPGVIDPTRSALIERLEGNDSLNVPSQNKSWILRFLRLKDYNVEEAYKLIENYYWLKVIHKKVFDSIQPLELLPVFEQNMFIVMPNRDQSGRRIFIFRSDLWDQDKFDAIELLKAIVLFIELSAYEPTTQIVGVQAIIDLKGLSISKANAMRKHASLIMDYLQFCSPLKIVKFHIVNQSKLVDFIIMVFRPFTSDIMHGKALYHGTDREKLHKWIFPQYLPQMYEGIAPLPTLHPEEWREILSISTQEYEKIMSYGVKADQLLKPIKFKLHKPETNKKNEHPTLLPGEGSNLETNVQ